MLFLSYKSLTAYCLVLFCHNITVDVVMIKLMAKKAVKCNHAATP